MLYRILADIVVIMHFIWILFMLVGFIFTLCAFFSAYVLPFTLRLKQRNPALAGRPKGFFDRWLFRTLHFFGIAYVSLKALMGKHCPLTLWENNLRQKYDPALTYPGSFMIHYVEKLVYPNINPLLIRIPTTFIAIFCIVVFIIRPPKKIKKIFK